MKVESPGKASTSQSDPEPPKVPEEAKDPVDVQKLWASLVGVGLIKSGGNIPGLDSPTIAKKEETVTSSDSSSLNSTTNKKPLDKTTVNAAEEPVKKKIKWETTVKKVKPVVLKSHDATIKT